MLTKCTVTNAGVGHAFGPNMATMGIASVVNESGREAAGTRDGPEGSSPCDCHFDGGSAFSIL